MIHSKLRRARITRASLVDLMRQHSDLLQPGWWRTVSPVAAIHTTATMPTHLARAAVAAHRGPLHGATLRLSSFAISPWPYVHVKSGSGARSSGAIYMNKRGEAVCFDLATNSVTRMLKGGSLEDYLHRRAIIQEFLPVPDVREAGRGRVVETLLNGDTAFALGADAKLQLLEDLFVRYQAHLASAPSTSSIETLERLRGDVRRASTMTPPHVSAFLLQVVDAMDADWPAFEMHGDLSGNNVVVVENAYYVIDFDDVTEHPFFFDLLLFALRDDVLRRKFFAGALRDCFAGLAQSACSVSTPDSLQHWLRYTVLRLAVDRSLITGEDLIDSIVMTEERLATSAFPQLPTAA